MPGLCFVYIVVTNQAREGGKALVLGLANALRLALMDGRGCLSPVNNLYSEGVHSTVLVRKGEGYVGAHIVRPRPQRSPHGSRPFHLLWSAYVVSAYRKGRFWRVFFSSPVWLRKRPGVCAELIRVRGNGVAHVSEEERTWPHSLFCFVHPVTPTLFGGTSGGGGVQVGTAVWQGQRASKQASGRPSACRGRRRGESLTLAGTMRHPWKARLSAPAAPAVSPLPTSPPGPKWTDPWRCSRSLTRLSGVRG